MPKLHIHTVTDYLPTGPQRRTIAYTHRETLFDHHRAVQRALEAAEACTKRIESLPRMANDDAEEALRDIWDPSDRTAEKLRAALAAIKTELDGMDHDACDREDDAARRARDAVLLARFVRVGGGE